MTLDLELAARVDRLDRTGLDHAASLGAVVRAARRAARPATGTTATGRPGTHPTRALGRPATTGR